jgi:transcriptional regulator with XRE-family HTH domain
MAQRRITSPGFRDQRYKKVIEHLKSRRLELGLSQHAIAERLGLHKQFVSRVELGERRLDIVELVDLARALEIDPAELVATIPDQ